MPYAITQACCTDASCVAACPVKTGLRYHWHALRRPAEVRRLRRLRGRLPCGRRPLVDELSGALRCYAALDVAVVGTGPAGMYAVRDLLLHTPTPASP